MNNSGLRIDKMNENTATEELVDKFPRAEKYLDWPMLVTFELNLM